MTKKIYSIWLHKIALVFGFCLLALLYGNQQPKTTYCSTHVAIGKFMQNPNLTKIVFGKTAWAIFLSLFLRKICHKFVGKAEMVQFKVS